MGTVRSAAEPAGTVYPEDSFYRHETGEVLAPGAGFGAEVLGVPDPTALHGHDFLEVAVVLAGSARHVSRDGAVDVRRGDAVAVRACDWHGWEQPQSLEVANVYVDHAVLRGAISAIVADPALRLLALPAAGGWSPALGVAHLDARVLEQVEHAVQAIATPRRSSAAQSVAALGQLLVVLGSVAAELPQDRSGDVHPAVWEALRTLEARLDKPWTVTSLAAAAGMSEGHLSRCFARAFGTPPMAVLASLRAERAAAHLIATDMGVAEIGRAVGWPDPNYFARRFRTLRGMSPRDFRSRVRGPALKRH